MVGTWRKDREPPSCSCPGGCFWAVLGPSSVPPSLRTRLSRPDLPFLLFLNGSSQPLPLTLHGNHPGHLFGSRPLPPSFRAPSGRGFLLWRDSALVQRSGQAVGTITKHFNCAHLLSSLAREPRAETGSVGTWEVYTGSWQMLSKWGAHYGAAGCQGQGGGGGLGGSGSHPAGRHMGMASGLTAQVPSQAGALTWSPLCPSSRVGRHFCSAPRHGTS